MRARAYEHLKNNEEPSTWNNTLNLTNDQLTNILHSFSISNNHGVKSSLIFLRNLERVMKEDFYRPIFILTAFSIAIHHHKVYNQLLAHDLMPLDISRFPLTCILLYCDAIHEWNRGVEVREVPELIDLDIHGDTVSFGIKYSHDSDISEKLEEIRCIRECISSEEYIKFVYSSVHEASR